MDELDGYLARLASATPTPGGGSAGCVVAAVGTALCAMVARITAAGERRAADRPQAEALAADADALRARFGVARTRDEAAYAAVVAAQALPRADDAQRAHRTAALQAALAQAAAEPLEAAALCAEGLRLAERAAALRNEHLASDVSCAVYFLRAALAAAVENVRVNHRYLRDPALVAAQEERLATIAAAAAEAEKRALATAS